MEQKPITQQEKTAKELRAEERLKRAKADIPPLAVVSCANSTTKSEVHTEVLLPENAPKEYSL